jgi:phosphatidylglycerophosphate synthase
MSLIKEGTGYIDTYYSKFVLETVPFWHTIGATPNALTTLGLITSLLCVYFLLKKRPVLSLVFLYLRMYFDFADGLLARKYGQTSKFGEWYDHIVDLFGFGIPFILVLAKSKRWYLFIIPTLVAMALSFVNCGCIERIQREKGNEASHSMSLGAQMCVSKPVFKFLDNGFLYSVLTVVIILYCYSS